ncbi:hypothetical protein RB614_09170 [Phytohabitans sp. ZYX-F-186]|uniref:Thymidylate kinase n=1 Tax=Phytohabitans maris TaxID=3071409 RepID=A0ABU0ZCA6_9ACTN|nr:hypothetical protein [Phytohabitans sp. ZYX-F-186]MDQ7904690.1 hypothetical protein [Phytohabitans sp. ZYX-F-186]
MTPGREGPAAHDLRCHRGRLISVEGISGVGKTHLTGQLLERHTSDGFVVLEEFSQRHHTDDNDLGRDLLRILIAAANGDPFLRSGHPGTETLLLLAIKTFDYENGSATALAQGRTVIEGRSVHSTAVYQSLIVHPDDQSAYQHAQLILDLAARWRPLPDLTILITDDMTAAIRRAETRDGIRYTEQQWQLHRRADALFGRLAADDPQRLTVLDRRRLTNDQLIDQMADHIAAASPRCLAETVNRTTAPARCSQDCQPQHAER